MAVLVPEKEHIFLDHIGLFVAQIEHATECLERLGFCLTPFVAHQHKDAHTNRVIASGTGNRCALFQEGYLEVLAASADTVLAQQLRASLTRYHGLHLIAFAHADAETRHRQLLDQQFPVQPLVRLQRSVTVQGTAHEARFSVIRPEPGTMPEGRIQIVTHHTPELVWQEEYQQQYNGAQALSAVLVCCADPGAAAQRFVHYLGLAEQHLVHYDRQTCELLLHRACVRFISAQKLAAIRPHVKPPSLPYISEIALRCASLQDSKTWFDNNNMPYIEMNTDAFWIAPEQALGMGLLFHQTAYPVW